VLPRCLRRLGAIAVTGASRPERRGITRRERLHARFVDELIQGLQMVIAFFPGTI
jgi:hypothetical protein